MKKKMHLFLAISLMLALVMTACGSSTAETKPAETDAKTEAEADAKTEAEADAQTETETEAETDAKTEAAGLDTSDNKVVIYSGAEEYRNEYFLKRIKEEFPDYDVTIEYMPTGNLAAKLAAEGTATDMDIFYDLDFSYAGLVEQYLADVSSYDQSIYVDDCKVENAHYLAATRNGGAIIVNPDVLAGSHPVPVTCS